MPHARNRRSGVEDRWHKQGEGDPCTEAGHGKPGTLVKSASHGKGKRWRARYVDSRGVEHTKGFDRKADAQPWLDQQISAIEQGTHVAPRDANIPVEQWCTTWLESYGGKRKNTIKSARSEIVRIKAEFGNMALSEIKPIDVKIWLAKLNEEGIASSSMAVLHNRLRQICADAIDNGLLARNPCSRKTAPATGKQKPYCATTAQVWALHDAMPHHLRVAVLLGAFAGLRIGEVAGLRVADVDFIRGVVHPKQQWRDEPLKTTGSDAPVPIPRELTLLLAASVKQWPSTYMVTGSSGIGRAYPRMIGDAVAVAKAHIADAEKDLTDKVLTLPAEFTFHDLRHYFASLLISSGADIKTVQARLRHESATTTLTTYSHLWPDADESTRSAVGAVISARAQFPADGLRTDKATT